MVALVTVIGGLFWQQQRIAEEQQRNAEQRAPQQQQGAFEDYLRAELLESNREFFPHFEPADLNYEILRSDDLNGDGLTDYFVNNKTLAFCGSGGCALDVYVTTAPGGVFLEACDPLVITPFDPINDFVIAPGAVFRERPDVNSRPATIGAEGSEVDPPDPSIIGVLPNGKWYLVNIWKGFPACGGAGRRVVSSS